MRYTFAAFTMALLLGACAEEPTMPETRGTSVTTAHDTHIAGGGELTADELRAIAGVRGATARFRLIAEAQAAGYTEQWPAGCAATPDGAQGFHFRNPALVDGSVDPLRPELLMYEPQPDGSLQLIGVDYYIPFELWTEPVPPRLLGREMMRNEALGIWALHIWAWRPNPSGMFAPWNPRASCDYAR